MFALVLECLLCVFTYCFKRTMVVFHYLGMETAVLVKCYKNLFRVVVNVTCNMSFLSRLQRLSLYFENVLEGIEQDGLGILGSKLQKDTWMEKGMVVSVQLFLTGLACLAFSCMCILSQNTYEIWYSNIHTKCI